MARVFNWRELLDEQRIAYIERGANVKRGEVNIRCPFCGAADPSYHMGLSPDTGWWACWRNKGHRGKSPLRLIVALLQIPYWKAREIAGLTTDYIDPEGFDAVAARILGHDGVMAHEPIPRPRTLTWPRYFNEIDEVSGWRHLRYLADVRGFGRGHAGRLCRQYELMCCRDDPDWENRVVIPYILDDHLVAWTGRAIGPARIRYKDLAIDDCLIPPKATLYNYDAIRTGGVALIAVEGPVDALKIDYFGRDVGVRAVALSTNSMTDEQLYMLGDAVGQFRRIFFMLDNASALGIVDSMRLRQRITHLPDTGIIPVPYGLKDAGEMSPDEATRFADDLAEELK